ncbi:MAG: hypothetical protein IJ265_09975 [Oscillospiraceae bacterium]|nr:hypothetical protein [Oscillospiraceae bacterium]
MINQKLHWLNFRAMILRRNIDGKIEWAVEEMVAMVDLYYRDKNGEAEDLSAELERLSIKLNDRADKLHIEHDEKYRNLNGMKMIFENVRHIDMKDSAGLENASKLIGEVLKLYKEHYDLFKRILKEFYSLY